MTSVLHLLLPNFSGFYQDFCQTHIMARELIQMGGELAQVGGELEAGKIEAGIQLEMEYPRGGYFIAAETQKRIGTRSNLLTITTKLQNPNEQLWQCH